MLEAVCDTTILRTLYFALVNCHLLYCVESWGSTYDSYLEPVRRLQKRAIRTITFSPYYEHSKPLFSRLKILPFDFVRELKLATCINGVVRNNEPFPISLLCIPRRQTRNQTFNNFNILPTKNAYSKRLLQYTGVKVWNGIPRYIKNTQNFSRSLKKYYFEAIFSA